MCIKRLKLRKNERDFTIFEMHIPTERERKNIELCV